ncbi:chromosome segregation protein SMC [Chondromyces apiculatus]|uniref:Chromosome partition protein Smc n=1 Tax=Chondromyces apiculatus DSM 436 TaxID=1192034 RepID=A0A017SXS6_9BACT|nr:chromosome segregation protein SMC [Chondromyces apiculatus]EYF01778.1 Chromosome partition protein smc [Chondromyces apiculatus DSM 436]
MRIRKLEIAGFKSFVDRTVVQFDSDVLGIVGPNGCGKSNIVDAIRWCIGEQSAKHLRGKSMSDVIFNGSDTRPAHGMAEVTLVFDNSDPESAAQLPLEYKDYSEIAVTRRLFRDGTSEYLINRTQVRLKDVTDLFLGTGVGTKAYSIIEQGKIGLIVSARPEDRRMLIEEAAGITKYKARKRQAEQKIEQTRQNLLRIGDIVSEIERNLASLKRQAAKAERYVSYRKEVEDLILHEASHKLLEITVLRQREQAAHRDFGEREQVARTALGTREAELEVSRQEALACEERAERAQNEAFAADNEVRTHEAEIARARDRFRHLEERRTAAAREQAELERSIHELTAERAQLEAQLGAVAEEEAQESELALEQHERLEEVRHGERNAEQELTILRKRAAEAAAAVAAAEATLAGFDRRMGEMGQRRVKLEDELGRLSFEGEDIERRRADLSREAAESAGAKQYATDERARLDAELKTLREQAVTSDRTVEQAKNELNQRRNRLRALEELHTRLEGVGAGVKNLLKTRDPALLGLVADRIEAPAELTAAFAALLGDKLQVVVVSDLERATALLGELAQKKQGRASVIAAQPLTPLTPASSTPPFPEGEGVIGPLIERLRYAPEDEALVRALVGDAVVITTPEVGARLAAEGARCALVSLDGMVFRPDGTVSGGQGDAIAAGMIEQKREMRELHEIVASKSDEVTAMLEAQQALRQRVTDVGNALERARSEAHQAELQLLTAEKDLKRAEEQLATAHKRRAVVDQELEDLREHLDMASGEQDAARERLDQNRRKLEEAMGGQEHAEQVAAEWRERVLAQQSIVTDRKVRLARVRERATAARSTVERLTRSCEELRGRIDRLDKERTDGAVGAGRAAATIMLAHEALRRAATAAHTAQATLTDARRTLDEARQRHALRESGLRELRQQLTAITEQLRKHELALEKLAIEHTHLIEGVRERFRGLELHMVMGDYHKRPPVEASHRARIVELTELLDRMGPVNLDAVREYAEAEERHTYYAAQKADLEKAIADLESAIAQMNRESKRLFKQTYDSVNARFKVLFPRMFRGGSAELRLTNPEDMLETGIEILAQPPGKKLGNIELMSGGEKALTAVSLIFSIFQHKPSPFCILDEVDAPLDEANVTRYNEAIRSMTSHSQFILITHIKRTMQSVDVLYGVTMQEPGVSKLVSVRVNENIRRAEAPPSAAVA